MPRRADIPIDGCFDCGRVTEEDGRSGRHVIVRFRCAHCPGSGKARLSEVRFGVARSCGRKKKAAFLAYHRRGAEWVSPSRVGAIFQAAEHHGRDRAAMMLDITPYQASFVWQRRCRELAATSDGMREAVYQSGQSSSPERVANEWNYRRQKSYKLPRASPSGDCKHEPGYCPEA